MENNDNGMVMIGKTMDIVPPPPETERYLCPWNVIDGKEVR